MTARQGDPVERIVVAFIDAFGNADYDRMAGLLAQDVRSYVTNAEGGVNLLSGRDAYMHAITSLD